MKIKTTKWIAILMAAMIGLFVIGCDNGSEEQGGFIPGNVDSIALSETNLIIPQNGTKKLTVTPAGITVVWSSSDEKIATVGDDGTITAIKAGTATITAAYGDASATCEVIVAETVLTEPPSSGGEIKLNYTELTLTPKSTIQLKVTPADTKVEWSSENKQVATVSETGRVSIKQDALKNTRNDYRTVNIIAKTADGKEAKCTIKVCEHIYNDNFGDSDRKCKICEFPIPSVQKGSCRVTVLGMLEYLGKDFYDSDFDGKLEVPYGVVGIEKNAFVNESDNNKEHLSITSVIIPSSVQSFSKNAFYGCENLKDVYYSGTKAEWNEIVFVDPDIGLADDVTIHGDDGTTWKYKE